MRISAGAGGSTRWIRQYLHHQSRALRDTARSGWRCSTPAEASATAKRTRGVTNNPGLEIDRAEISRFVHALFRHADPGTIVSLRAFRDGASGPPFAIAAQTLGEDHGNLIDAATR